MKWFDKRGFNYQIISEHKGEEAGIKSSTIKVEGDYLYGLMKSEFQVFIDSFVFLLLIVALEDTRVLRAFGFILL